ncbi:MAG TPA: efflux RND transporter periplasmic adaptor subunit [Steroidobacteraceae bacterium]
MDTPLVRPPAWRRYAPYGIGVLLLLGVIVWLLAGANRHVYRVPIDRLTIGEVTQGPFEDFIAVRSTAAPFTTHYLTADQGGTVKDVLAEDGTTVKAGQPLIILANTALQLQVASREADTASQINALENTKLQLEETRFKYQHDLLDIEHQISKLTGDLARDKILLDGNAIAPAIYKQEEEEYSYELKLRAATTASRDAEQKVRATQLTQLQETLARLNESIATAKASLDALNVRAPTDGQLTALNAEVGQSKAPGTVLGQVDSLERFKLTAQVDEFYLGRIVLGQVAPFTSEGRDYKANVAKIYPQVANGTFRIDLNFDNPNPEGIHTGQAFDIRLELGRAATAKMLPNGPFYQETGGNWVFVVAPDGRYATRRNVSLGRRNPEHVEVVDGLQTGEKVIVSGYEAFQKIERVEFEKPGHGSH